MATHFKSGAAIGTKGTATDWTLWKKVTATVDPASIPANTTANTAVTQADVKAGDVIQVLPPSTIESGIAVAGAWCAVDGTIQLRLANVTVGAIDPASATWTFVLLRS